MTRLFLNRIDAHTRDIAAGSECIDEPMTRFLVFFSALPGYSQVFIASQPDERI